MKNRTFHLIAFRNKQLDYQCDAFKFDCVSVFCCFVSAVSHLGATKECTEHWWIFPFADIGKICSTLVVHIFM